MGATPAPLIRASAADAIKAVVKSKGATRVPKPLVWNPSRHLTSRFAFGPWGNEVVADPDAWFENQVQLGLNSPGYAGVDGLTARYPYLSLSTPRTKLQLAAEGNVFAVTAEDQGTRATLLSQAWSPAQLYETVVDFFTNRLHVASYSDGVQANRVAYDRDVIRKYAFDNYRDMLLAAMKHPAMLTFFTNTGSNFTAPTENLGRELLELHTVGRAAGYTQADVVASARMLTGRGVETKFSDYQWSTGFHDVNPIQVMDYTATNDSASQGEDAGDAYISYLAGLPATATSLAHAMCVRFVSDDPSDALVAAVADAYLDNDTAILPMLRTILRSTEFWDSRGAKLRRPVETIIATLRALRVTPVDLDTAAGTLQMWANSTNNRPMAYTGPGGYPDTAAPWMSSSSLLRLWNFQMTIVKGLATTSFTKPSEADLYGGPTPTTMGPAVDMMFRNLLSVSPTPAESQAIQQYLGETPDTSMTKSKMRLQFLDVATLMMHTAHQQLR